MNDTRTAGTAQDAIKSLAERFGGTLELASVAEGRYILRFPSMKEADNFMGLVDAHRGYQGSWQDVTVHSTGVLIHTGILDIRPMVEAEETERRREADAETEDEIRDLVKQMTGLVPTGVAVDVWAAAKRWREVYGDADPAATGMRGAALSILADCRVTARKVNGLSVRVGDIIFGRSLRPVRVTRTSMLGITGMMVYDLSDGAYVMAPADSTFTVYRPEDE